ncbi:Putative target SNARE coiled-coil domain, syntaxin/epimorphin [Septoria linicola]|uniref:Target SNARE coiled-coil domain, syntaxin/epimorphin n=1 Tax=Septoria linicola TaxID=215465 RepID=A0A9Q9EIQ6_9PEZI|nr:putative target SNARE coiled-coil domain, syntaxin/epimorphin [Septoria linicola]USW52275.1 Putative target SNARE coiled-coil domain, syntaxin/epimorphin [Septoria linicola]
MSTTAVNLGAWRDRTNLFISYRQSYTHHPAKRTRITRPSNGRFNDTPDDSERAGLMSHLDNDGDGDAVIEMDVLPPPWLDIQDHVSQTLSSITSKVKRLDQMHAKHVLPGFDDEGVKAKDERDIEALTQDITKDFISCRNAIRRIDRLQHDQQQPSGGARSDADATMARNLKISLASRVGDVSTLFRKKQSAYLKKMRTLGGMHTPLDRAGTPVAQNPYNDPAMMESETDRSAAQSTLLQTAQVRRRGAMDGQIEQREREIEKIAHGVIDLSNLFQELNTMVIDQGTVLDRIDYNVERTAEHVKEADKELKVATRYQKKSAKRKIILLLVLIVVGVFILLLMKRKRSRASAPAAPPATAPNMPAPKLPDAGLPPRLKKMADVNHHPIPGVGSDAESPEWKRRRRRLITNS